MDPLVTTMVLVVVAVIAVMSVRATLRRPTVLPKELVDEETRREDYLDLARRDGVDPDTATAFATEIAVGRREAHRREQERRDRESGDVIAGLSD